MHLTTGAQSEGNLQEVPLMVVEKVPDGSAVWARPMTDLPPNTSFDMTDTAQIDSDIILTTGPGPITQPPPAPGAAVSKIPDGLTCDDVQGFQVTVQTTSEPKDTEPNFVEVVLSIAGQPDQITFDHGDAPFQFGKPVDVVNCTQTPNLPSAALGQNYTVTVTQFDRAGNPSPPTVVQNATVAQSKATADPWKDAVGACGGLGCGCEAVGASSTSTETAIAFAAIAFAGSRLRRRR